MLNINPAVAAIEEETAFTVLDRANALKAKKIVEYPFIWSWSQAEAMSGSCSNRITWVPTPAATR